MPVVLTPEDEQAALKKADSSLRFIMDKNDVPVSLQAKFYHIGVDTVAKFATFATSADDMKDVVRREFGLDPSTSLTERVAVTNLLVGYETARNRT